jgi:hypothetical protein
VKSRKIINPCFILFTSYRVWELVERMRRFQTINRNVTNDTCNPTYFHCTFRATTNSLACTFIRKTERSALPCVRSVNCTPHELPADYTSLLIGVRRATNTNQQKRSPNTSTIWRQAPNNILNFQLYCYFCSYRQMAALFSRMTKMRTTEPLTALTRRWLRSYWTPAATRAWYL